MTHLLYKGLLALLILSVSALSTAAKPVSTYSTKFVLTLTPGSKTAQGEIALKPGTGAARQLTLRLPKSRFSGVRADGKLEAQSGGAESFVWTPPAAGGSLRYTVQLESRRSNGAYDALTKKDWAIFRADKVFPKAKVRAKGRSESLMVVNVPKAWHVNAGYERRVDGLHEFVIDDPTRKFDAPSGWMIAGDIANRAETIAGTKVIIAAPQGLGARRQDVLAMLSYNLPELRRAFGSMPKVMLIVLGPDPMWRGGLSGPNSLFLHMDRPMISENGTSTLLHELTHSITRTRGGKNADWIAEGLAEFYAVETLRRSGGISEERYKDTLSELRSWSKKVTKLRVERSSGEITARAALLLIELDQEIRKATGNKKSLDDVTRKLLREKVSNEEFAKAVEALLGRPSKVLQSPLLR